MIITNKIQLLAVGNLAVSYKDSFAHADKYLKTNFYKKK